MKNFSDKYVYLLMQCTKQQFNYTSLTSYYALKLLKHHFQMECPRFDERLQSLAVRSHAHFVHAL